MPPVVAPVPPEGRETLCPGCRACLSLDTRNAGSAPLGPYLKDGDILPIRGELPVAERDADDWYAGMMIGDCPQCGSGHYALDVTFASRRLVEDGVPWHDRLMGDHEPLNFVVTDGDVSWVASRYDTPRGSFVYHDVGPFSDPDDTDWVGPDGVSFRLSGSDDSWGAALDFAAARWAALREASRLILSDPSEVRPNPPRA